MKKLKSAIWALIVILVLCIALTACSGGGEDNPPPEEPPTGETSFVYEGLKYEKTEGYLDCVTLLGPVDKDITTVAVPAEANGYEVNGIATSAFEGCTSLERVVIEANMDSNLMGTGCFKGCTSLEYFENLGQTGSEWFVGCTSLTEVKGGRATLIEIGIQYPEAFNSWKDVKTQIKKLTVVDLDQNVHLYGMTALTEVVFEGNCTQFPSFQYCPALEKVEIPEGITELNSNFLSCDSLREITLPSTLKTINGYLIDNNVPGSLKRLNISDLEAFLNIEFVAENKSALYDTYSFDIYLNGEPLKDLTIPESVTRIPDSIFSCASIESLTLHNGVTEIGTRTFKNCTSLVTLELPDSVTKIGEEAFGGVTLASLKIGSGLSELGTEAFSKNVYEVWNQSPLDLEGYFTGAYAVHTDMNDTPVIYIIDGSIIHKEEGVAYGTLIDYKGEGGKVTLPTVDEIPKYSIATRAFNMWDYITEIDIPSCVYYISADAFSGSTIEKIQLYGSETEVDYNAFRGATWLWDIYSTVKYNVSEENPYGWHTDFTEPSVLDRSIEDFAFVTLDEVPYLIFYNGISEEITLPENYKGEKYMLYTGSLTNGKSVVTKIQVPNGALCGIQKDAVSSNFYEYVDGVSYFGEWVIKADSFTPSGGATVAKLVVRDGTVGIADYAFDGCDSEMPLVLPESLMYVGYRAFKNYEYLPIVLPSKLAYVGEEAFDDAAAVGGAAITLPEGLVYIGKNAFNGARLTGAVKINKDAFVGDCAFLGSGLDEIILADGAALSVRAIRGSFKIIRIGVGAQVTDGDELSGYYYNGSLEKIYVTSLDEWLTFVAEFARISPQYSGVELYIDGVLAQSVTVPEGVTELPANAFFGISLKEITLPDSITTLKEGSLMADGLETVKGGTFVATVESGAISSLDLVESHIYGNIEYRFMEALRPVSLDITWAMPKAGTALPARFFEDCTKLSQVFVPVGCTLGEKVFVSVPSYFTVIFEDGFGSTSAWAQVESEEKTYTLGTYYDELEGTYGTVKTYMGIDGGFAYERVTEGEAEIIGYFGGNITPTVPTTVDGRTVTGIAALAFLNRTELTSVTVSEGITQIGVRAFEGCTSLTAVSLPASIQRILSLAFESCTALTSVSVTSGGSFAIADLSGSIVGTVDSSDSASFAAKLIEQAICVFGKL